MIHAYQMICWVLDRSTSLKRLLILSIVRSVIVIARHTILARTTNFTYTPSLVWYHRSFSHMQSAGWAMGDVPFWVFPILVGKQFVPVYSICHRSKCPESNLTFSLAFLLPGLAATLSTAGSKAIFDSTRVRAWKSTVSPLLLAEFHTDSINVHGV